MVKTYKIKYSPRTGPTKRRFTRWLLVLFIMGLIVGYWKFWNWHENQIEKERKQISRVRQSLTLYNNLNLVLSKILDLNESFQEILHSDSPNKTQEINRLNSKLQVLKRKFRSIENRVAMLENRKEKEIGIAFLEPRQSPKVEKDNRIELYTVRGRVIDINGVPRSEVKVKIQKALIGTTNEAGEYIIKNVPMGTYSIQAVSGNKESGKKHIVVNETAESPFEIIFPNPIKEMLFCKEIQKYRYLDENVEWVIIGQSDDFPSTIEKVICYIEVIGAEKNMVIKHRWFWHDRLEFEIPLEVKSSNWRSFSEKIIAPEKTGTWRVEVIKADDDTVLASRSFTVR